MKCLRLNNNKWWLLSVEVYCGLSLLLKKARSLHRCGGDVCSVAMRCSSIDSVVLDVMKCEPGFGEKCLAWNVLLCLLTSPWENSSLTASILEIYYYMFEGQSNCNTPNNGFSVAMKISCEWEWVCMCVFVCALGLQLEDWLSHILFKWPLL